MAKKDAMKKENTVIQMNNGVGCADELIGDKDTMFEQEIMDILLPSEPEEKPRKKLKRVLKAEALTRMENAARSEEEFNDVIEEWDHLDSNRRRRERDHEVRSGTRPLNAGLRDLDGALIVPRWMSQPLQRQMLRGDYIEMLSACPYEMHDLTDKQYVRKAIVELKESHKELLFYLDVQCRSPQEVAESRDQTDRNIRKVRQVIYRKLRKSMYYSLIAKQKKGYQPSERESRFIERYAKGMEESDAYAV